MGTATLEGTTRPWAPHMARSPVAHSPKHLDWKFMRKLRAAVTVIALIPAFSVLPVMTPSFASDEPVEPGVQQIALEGVDRAVAVSAVGRASALAVDEAVEAIDPGVAPLPTSIAAPVEPLVLTTERETGEFETLGVTWAADSGESELAVVVRTRSAGEWTDWQQLELLDGPESAEGSAPGVRDGTEPMWVGRSDAVQARVEVLAGQVPQDLRVDLIDPGESAYDGQVGAAPAATADAAASQPTIHSRAEWGADESIRKGSPSYMSEIKAGTLHHTAGRNGYSESEVPGIIRGDYAYHVKVRGWSDLGYNFVVDRFGRMWEGRAGGVDRAVQGAHTGGFNSDTFGVSVLGDYTKTSTSSSSTLVDSLVRLFSWKLSLSNVDPGGSTTLTSAGGGTSRYAAGEQVRLPVIFGHRDVGLTSCPGSLYDHLGTIRSKAQANVPVMLSNPTATWADTSVRVTSGLAPDASWRARVISDATGAAISGVRGTGSTIDTTLALTSASTAVPSGDYHVLLEAWTASSTATPWRSPSHFVQRESGIGAARLGDGSLVVARNSSSGGVEVSTAAAGGRVDAPVSLGGAVLGAPSVVRQGDGAPAVLVRGADNNLYLKRRQPDGSWQRNWERGPAGLGGRPSAVPAGSGAGLEVFARSTSGSVTWFTRSPSGTWTSRTAGGAVAPGTGVGAARTADGSIHLAVHGTDHKGWASRYAGGRWAARWTPLGGVLQGDVEAAAVTATGIVVVGQGTDTRPYSLVLAEGERTWEALSYSGTPAPPTLAEPQGGRAATVLVADHQGGIGIRERLTDGWSAMVQSPKTLGAVRPVGGTALQGGSVVVARTTTTGAIEVRSGSSVATLGSARTLDGSARGAPTVVVQQDGTPTILVRGTNNVLYTKKRQVDGRWPSGWERGPAGLGGRPDAVVVGGALEVFAPSAKTGAVVWSTRSVSGSWNSRAVGGAVAGGSGVGVARTPDGTLHLAVNGTDGQGWYTRSSGGRWSNPWTRLGGVLRGDVGLAATSAGSVLATASGANDISYTNFVRSGTGWMRLSSEAAKAAPSVSETGSTGATVLRPNSNGVLESRSWSEGGWSGWARIG